MSMYVPYPVLFLIGIVNIVVSFIQATFLFGVIHNHKMKILGNINMNSIPSYLGPKINLKINNGYRPNRTSLYCLIDLLDLPLTIN